MKILSNFDTNFDLFEFIKAKQSNDHVILFKQHPIALVKILIVFIISIIIILGGYLLNYVIVPDNMWFFTETIYIIGLFFYIVWTIIVVVLFKRAFLNEKYLFEKESDFDWRTDTFSLLIKFSLVLLFLEVMLFMIWTIASIWSLTFSIEWILMIKAEIILSLLLLFTVLYIIRILIFFKMSFCIITPSVIKYVDQKWFFKRHVTSIDIGKIKSINTRNTGVLWSIFRTWKLMIFLEGDTNNHLQLKINHIANCDYIIENIYLFKKKW